MITHLFFRPADSPRHAPRQRLVTRRKGIAPARLLLVAGMLGAPSLSAQETTLAAATPPIPASVVDAAKRNKDFPSLRQVAGWAREQAPAVVSAQAFLAIARSSHVGARMSSFDNPYVELLADRGSHQASRNVTVQASIWLPVELSGQRGRRIAEADALVQWQQASLTSVRFAAVGEAVHAYGYALVATARVRLLDEIVAASRDEAELYRGRLAARDATDADEKLAMVELSRNVLLLDESRAELTRVQLDLSRVTGRNVPLPTAAQSEIPPALARSWADAASADREALESPHVASSTSEAHYFARARDRAERSAQAPVSFIATAGRGDVAELRVGAGVAWSLPTVRTNQGEQARATAERARALAEAAVKRRTIALTLRSLWTEFEQIREARQHLETTGESAAKASVEAALATLAAGKGEMLRVLTARRDWAFLRLRRIDLIKREWEILGEVVAITGDVP